MRNILVRLVTDETGTTVIEYGVIAFLLSLGIVGALIVINMTLGGIYTAIGNGLAGAL